MIPKAHPNRWWRVGFGALLLIGGFHRAAAAAPPVVASAIQALPFEERLTQAISADFKGVDLASAVQFLSDNAGVTILLSEKAKQLAKPVTVHLVEMPLNRALEYLLSTQGLLYRVDGQAVWIATRDEMEAEPMETRVYFLKQGPGLFAAFQPMAETRQSVALQATSLKQLKTVKDILSEVIPQVGQSSMMLDERSGALVVTNVPYYLQQVERLLVQLDVTPIQVLIEARFLEVTMSDSSEWNATAKLTGNVALTKTKDRLGNGSLSPGLQLSSVGTTLAQGTASSFTSFTNQTSGNGLNLALQGILTGTQYSAVLHSLMKNDRTKTLSSPRVTTLNNQTATIKIVNEYVYTTKYEPTVVRELVKGVVQQRITNVPQDFVTKDLGILLHVTPSVGQDLRTITLALKPEVSEKKRDDKFGDDVVLPRFTTRNLETTVMIENGQTVMLGGLMKDTTAKTVTRVPVLGSLPVVGKLFRKEQSSVERSNLLIFVTAQILDPSGAHLASSKDASPH